MYVLFEDSGKFKAEKIFADADSTMQVESASGKRSKIRKNNVFFEFAQPDPTTLLEQAEQLAAEFDVDFLWECAPKEEFSAIEFAEDYFGHTPSAVEKTALIFALHGAPAYFHRKGKGLYRPAPPEILEAALAAIEKKRLQAEQQDAWTQAMIAGELPEPIAAIANSLLSAPDKNTLEWKAFDAAVQHLGVSPEKLLLDLNAWSSPLALHRHRFFSNYFPRGIEFPEIELATEWGTELPVADIEAYSVDDEGTTEIDDALSIQSIGENQWRVGVHIATPGLAVQRDNELDQLARKRLSTLYTPGQKVPMLPEAVIRQFSLDEGLSRPAISLYVDIDLEKAEILQSQTRLERIVVKENLRQHKLDPLVTQEALDNPDSDIPYAHWIRPLWAVTQYLAKQRELVRGRPENNNRVEFLFDLDGAADDPDSLVRLIPRVRNAPIGLITAEMMILANNHWGGLLAQHDVPGIYRSQQNMRTRMSTHALPHDSIGVPQYAWSTSPLRRYVDLVNQWQILAAAEHGVSARLVAPFKPKEADLFGIVGAFEAQYTAWNDFQNTIERYWVLRWLQQQNIQQMSATVIKEDLVRFDSAPFVMRVPGLGELERGQQLMLDILSVNELDLTVEARLRELIQPPSTEDHPEA
ncbi:ribonuclease catalytic domain-containing protein [Paenalcaligenes faecalis]|uniref:ribonuclease catalytic domain-containing protein n=1 Tax=Paenalcaligenes faecalis TaxID=2980099 RepID=UPI0022B9AE5B|nr:ribonuclease catalytic domain-containing protein [Paenalcaligenes faecalis]